jgi:hypothetical protein
LIAGLLQTLSSALGAEMQVMAPLSLPREPGRCGAGLFLVEKLDGKNSYPVPCLTTACPHRSKLGDIAAWAPARVSACLLDDTRVMAKMISGQNHHMTVHSHARKSQYRAHSESCRHVPRIRAFLESKACGGLRSRLWMLKESRRRLARTCPSLAWR